MATGSSNGARSYAPVVVEADIAEAHWWMICTDGHERIERTYPGRKPAIRSAMRHLKTKHPEIVRSMPPRGGNRAMSLPDPVAAKVDLGDLISIAEAAKLLGYQNANPTSAVISLIRHGTLTAYADPAAAGAVSAGRLVLRSQVLQVRATRTRRLQRQAESLQALERDTVATI